MYRACQGSPHAHLYSCIRWWRNRLKRNRQMPRLRCKNVRKVQHYTPPYVSSLRKAMACVCRFYVGVYTESLQQLTSIVWPVTFGGKILQMKDTFWLWHSLKSSFVAFECSLSQYHFSSWSIWAINIFPRPNRERKEDRKRKQCL